VCVWLPFQITTRNPGESWSVRVYCVLTIVARITPYEIGPLPQDTTIRGLPVLRLATPVGTIQQIWMSSDLVFVTVAPFPGDASTTVLIVYNIVKRQARSWNTGLKQNEVRPFDTPWHLSHLPPIEANCFPQRFHLGNWVLRNPHLDHPRPHPTRFSRFPYRKVPDYPPLGLISF